MAAGLAAGTLYNVGILLMASFILGELFERIGLESILGYITAGLLLGPSFLSVMDASAVQSFATIGVSLVLFNAGLREENAADIFRHRQGLQLGLGILAGSFALIFAALYFFGSQFLPYNTLTQFLFIALAYAVVDIGIPSKIMMSRGMLREETGKYTIKSAVINVTAGLLALTGLVLVFSPGENIAMRLGGILGFAAVFYLLHETIHRIDDYIINFEETEAQFAITFAFLLGLSYMTEIVGLSTVLGAFFAGIIVSRSDFSESKAFQEKINAIGLGLFIPIFFAWFGLGLHVSSIIANIEAAVFLFGLSTVSKLGIGYAASKLHGMDKPGTIAASLISLDIETLVVLLIGKDMGLFGPEILQMFAPAVLLSTLTIVLLYALIDRR
ncbi:cation:proton antiporter [Candidatus Nanohalovita haloferacivicina]|uniref:cation:proton antiporter n=1 Tax=Candidatus Nanohalovita haloferacivicina TaxID=2978046 RepID=UPI00325FAE13|nr:Kef-type K+ transport system, membrane componentKefB [Candidatus Nanohalobia archaeon BNXNv]